MLKRFKRFFTQQTFEVIIFDGKKMSYQHLTQKKIDALKKDPKCKEWIITIKDEIDQ